MSKLMTNEYARLLAEVKERVRAAQYAAFRAVNKELVVLYWDIGRMISKRQVTGMHGDAVVEQLASDLRMEFPGVGGFSRRNVFYMREFYIAYRDLPKVQPLVAQIGWTQNLIVLQRCRDPLEREFYIRMTEKVRLDQERAYPSDREPELREDPARPDQFRQSPDARAACAGKAGRQG